MSQLCSSWVGATAAGVLLMVLGLLLMYIIVRLCSAAVFRSLYEFLNQYHNRKG